jgi:hypothetical protein
VSKIDLPRLAKPSKALGSDRTRKALGRAYVVEPNGHRELIASDSYIMARIPVADDVPLGNLSGEALKRIEKGERHEVHDDGIEFLTKDGVAVKYPADRGFSMFEKNVPEFDATDRTIAIGINPKLLASLAEALGAAAGQGVRLEIPLDKHGNQELRAMRVTAILGKESPKPSGLIMPIRLDA